MAIRNPADVANIEKKIKVLIAGFPGIGKTTLGLSAPRPLHIDVDRGLDRVAAAHRHPFIQPESYGELLEDLTAENLRDFETLVFDTGGQLIKLIGEWAKAKSSFNRQGDGTLSRKGYGVTGKEFENLMNKAYYQLNKHVIVIFHAKETKEENEAAKLNLMVEGQTRDNVWLPMDLGGYIQMQGRDRTITFENNERHFGKRCHGVAASLVIPDLTGGGANTFFTDIFKTINESIKKDAEMFEREKLDYESAKAESEEIVESITDIRTAKAAAEKIQGIAHKRTSLAEAKALFLKRLNSLNIVFDKATGKYVEKTPPA